jgi:hypothetical protein
MYVFSQFIKKEKKPGSKWTGYHKLFDRYIFTDTFVDDEIEETDISKN